MRKNDSQVVLQDFRGELPHVQDLARSPGIVRETPRGDQAQAVIGPSKGYRPLRSELFDVEPKPSDFGSAALRGSAVHLHRIPRR